MMSRLKVAVSIYLFWVAFFVLARCGFLLYNGASSSRLTLGAIAGIFLAGLRLDLSAAAYLSVLPIAFLAVSAFRPFLDAATAVIWLWLVVAVVVTSALVAADLEIASQWSRRIDASVLLYLSTPREAWASAGVSPRGMLIGVVVGSVAVSLAIARRLVLQPVNRLEGSRWWAAVPCVALIGPLFLAGRGGTQTWPLTVSSAYHSTEAFANLAAQNAAWGFFDSIYRRLYDRTNPFRVGADSAALAAIHSARQPAGERHRPPLDVARPNVMVIVWESATARAFGSLGGVEGITPRFDSLAKSGIRFRRFYGAGDRTDKGIAAILSASPAIPRGSIVTVPSKTASLPSLSADLGRIGYSTAFYYGGELEFASLKAYLTNAGFDRVIGKADFPRSSWNSKWGAHDGVVAERLLADLDRARQPFFAVWLTLSSHEPFETPDPPTIAGTDWQSRFFNAMRYTDRVVGDLIAAASTKAWWEGTLVVIVADHGRRVLPLDAGVAHQSAEAGYRIPMLWLGGALTSRDSVVDAVSSQLDIAPTLLDAFGLEAGDRYQFGRSLLRPVRLPFGYYGFDEGFGIVTDGGAMVYDHRAGRVTSRVGRIGDQEQTLGAAMLQLSYQDYLDR